jgi:hypothetical protein
MGRSKFQKAKGRAESGSFVKLPHQVIRSPQFAALPATAVKALCGLLAQYRGNNNGDLVAALSIMQDYGWTSRDTLKRALDDLLAAGFIIVTRQGGNRIARLYAVTFYAVDACDKFDPGIKATAAAPGKWKQCEPLKKKMRDRLAGRYGTASRVITNSETPVTDREPVHKPPFRYLVSDREPVPFLDIPGAAGIRRAVND